VLRRLVALLVASLGVVALVAPAGAAEVAPPKEFPVRAVGTVPTDPLYGSQWGPAKVGMTEAWDRTKGSTSTVIAVIDTGVNPSEPDLAGKVLSGADFVFDGKSGDPNGHGTFVARVAAANANDGIGLAGYCWQCWILPVRVLDADGNGDTGAVALGIRWAADNGADIINLSLAGDFSSVTLDSAILYAQLKGILVVAAAGNQTAAAQNLSQPQYPAASPGVIAVSASDTSDNLYSWSFRGSWSDVTAPGCILNGSSCGTSYASPAVAAILALGQAVAPNAAPATLTAALFATVAPVDGGVVAYGRVNAASFLSTAAPTPVTAVRVAGASRVATAVELSKRGFSSAPAVVLARSDAYADALAAAPLAAKLGAPVLLTGTSGLDPLVAAEIQRLGATSAWLIGGEGALSSAVEAGARSAGATDVRRIAGASRYDTAGKIAQEVGGTTVYVASASGFADAVAVSALAAFRRAPILLVDQTSVPAATSAALTALGATSVTVVGGAGVIADSVVSSLNATRIAGTSRYETSRLVAEAAKAAGADGRRVWVATGGDWPDALAAGPAAAADGGVLLLSDPAGSSVASWLGTVSATGVTVVGGAASVSDSVLATLQSLLG
jgi:minor extracellular protease Epr